MHGISWRINQRATIHETRIDDTSSEEGKDLKSFSFSLIHFILCQVCDGNPIEFLQCDADVSASASSNGGSTQTSAKTRFGTRFGGGGR
jgi:hypothetical protein